VSPADDSPEPPLDDEERAFRASLEQLVDWVRVDSRRLFARAFVPALVLVPAGGLLVGAGMSGRLLGPRHGVLALLLGLVCIAAGALWALVSLIRAMGHDAYVAIRQDGLGVRLAPPAIEVVHPWDDIEDATADAEAHAVRLLLASGDSVLLRGPFAGLSDPQLARRIRDARRLALWHRLTPEALRNAAP
jgi:hypothetical protein